MRPAGYQAKSEQPCKACGCSQKARAMVFKNLPYCSENCRKELAERERAQA